MVGYILVKLDDILKKKGEEETQKILSTFENALNSDVDNFLHYKAIEFSKKGLSKTQLVLASYKNKYEIAGYFIIANKNFSVKSKSKAISKTMKKRISKFGTYDSNFKIYVITAPLIAQLGKNTKYPSLITGDELLEFACMEVKKVQSIVGGKIVYLECEDNEKLKEFYKRNGFIEFDKRALDADEEVDFKGKYLIQMLKYLH